ncbi:hypothetical protein C0J52_03917 [Blattella germanica]|nr:hypothetical protein C0J52_03917 [Blattella germanica]
MSLTRNRLMESGAWSLVVQTGKVQSVGGIWESRRRSEDVTCSGNISPHLSSVLTRWAALINKKWYTLRQRITVQKELNSYLSRRFEQLKCTPLPVKHELKRQLCIISLLVDFGVSALGSVAFFTALEPDLTKRDDCPSLRTIERWYLQFKHKSLSLDDDPSPERPIELSTPENVAAVEKAMKGDRGITYRHVWVVCRFEIKSRYPKFLEEFVQCPDQVSEGQVMIYDESFHLVELGQMGSIQRFVAKHSVDAEVFERTEFLPSEAVQHPSTYGRGLELMEHHKEFEEGTKPDLCSINRQRQADTTNMCRILSCRHRVTSLCDIVMSHRRHAGTSFTSTSCEESSTRFSVFTSEALFSFAARAEEVAWREDLVSVEPLCEEVAWREDLVSVEPLCEEVAWREDLVSVEPLCEEDSLSDLVSVEPLCEEVAWREDLVSVEPLCEEDSLSVESLCTPSDSLMTRLPK